MNPRITPTMLLEHQPCRRYPPKRIHAILGRGKTLSQILNLTAIPCPDRLWVGIRYLSFEQRLTLPDRAANRAVRACLRLSTSPGLHTWAHDWLTGKDRDYDRTFALCQGLENLNPLSPVLSRLNALASFALERLDHHGKSNLGAFTTDWHCAGFASATKDPKAAQREYRQQLRDLREIIKESP